MIPTGCVAICPGCKQREFSAAESAAQKQAWVETNLRGIVDFIHPIISPGFRWSYRRKATLHAKREGASWAFGLVLRRQREELFIPIPECPVQSPLVNQLFSACRSLPGHWPLAFVQISGKAITLVMKSARDAGLVEEARREASRLLAAGAESLFLNWNAAAGRRVLSSRHMELIAGPKFLQDGEYLHGPASFRQQIPELEDLAHRLAFAHLKGEKKILDLYCGLGITLSGWRKAGLDALGVELVGEACELALLNAPGATVLKGKVEERIPQLRKIPREFGIYTNPPRDGHGAEVAAWLNGCGAERIAYLSCNMRSLKDDLQRLTNYRASSAQPFDFFPQTDHVEALVFLTRVGNAR